MSDIAPPIEPTTSLGDRSAFIARTYAHLLGAALLFVALEVWFFSSGIVEQLAPAMLSVNWLLILGAFILVAMFCGHFAHTLESVPAQYLALGTYVLAEAIIFVPLLYVADRYAPGVILSAGYAAVIGFSALTFIGFYTRKNFSFLGPFLLWIGLGALGLIVVSVLFGFSLGPAFSVAMIVFAGAAILYDTSNVIHEYGEGQHVAAALELFSSFALLLWYLIRFGIHFADD